MFWICIFLFVFRFVMFWICNVLVLDLYLVIWICICIFFFYRYFEFVFRFVNFVLIFWISNWKNQPKRSKIIFIFLF
jgi:hypothetical protein